MPVFLPLSVVIISLNEAQRIGLCIVSVRELADDIVVVDALSRDRTVEVAKASGARVVCRAWTGYSDQKNYGNELARHDWILSLDADECVTPELATAIRELFAQGPDCAAYAIRFENYFGATRVRFGAWNPDWHVRLFDRRHFHWNCNEVHEGLRSSTALAMGKLRGRIRHRTVDSHTQLAAKTQRYSALFADKLRRQCRRPAWSKIWLNPAFRFTRDYLFRGGVLDGYVGLVIAWESARYTHLKYRLAAPLANCRDVSWRWLAPVVTGIAVLPIVAAIFLGRGLFHERTSLGRHPPGTDTVAVHEDDEFDNNPISNSAPPIDEDVLI